MIMETQTVHFRVGAEMGIRLHEIANEHLTHDLDPIKAISVFSESFGENCPDDLLRKLLIGEMIILVDEEEQMFNVVDRADHMAVDSMYPKLDVSKWVLSKIDEIGNRGKDLYDALIETNRQLSFSQTFQFEFDADKIIEFAQGNEELVLDEIREDERVKTLSDMIRYSKMYLDTVFKLKNVFKILASWYPNQYIESGNLVVVSNVMYELQYLLNNKFLKDEKYFKDEEAPLDKYIQTEIEFTKLREETKNNVQTKEVISKGLQPVDLMDNYDAGWLAPDGVTFYGMNGEYANMLHNKLADAMYIAGVIPQGNENENNPDQWLEENGWAKIHGNHVTYGGYAKANFHKKMSVEHPDFMGEEECPKDVPITPEQVNAIADYVMHCHQSLIRVGLPMYKMSATTFRTIDPIQFKLKFFEI